MRRQVTVPQGGINQATGLSTSPADWGTVPDSATTNQVLSPLNPAAAAEFYQLVYP